MYKIEIKIDQLPKTINQQSGKHWSFRAGEANKWRFLVSCAIGHKKPLKPLEKVSLKLTRASSAPPDYDNLVHSFKAVMDSLIKLGIIIDDNMEVVGKPDYNWMKAPKNEGYVLITVEEI